MNQKILADLLNVDEREALYYRILNSLQEFSKIDSIEYQEYKISEGIIPVLYVGNGNTPKNVKVFIAAQHNEYNGLFGMIEFFTKCQQNSLEIRNYNFKDQFLIFFPLMNPYGFLNPKLENKSGYYLKDGSNLNRYWRKIFVPEFKETDEFVEFPDQVILVKDIIKKYWNNEDTSIYIMDFHETSLMAKYLKKLNMYLSEELYSYNFTHWLEEWIIVNIFGKDYNDLFINTGFDIQFGANVNLSLVCDKLTKFAKESREKLMFYFCHSPQSKNYVKFLAHDISNSLKDKLWGIKNPLYDHSKHDHGCFVKMNEATNRPKIYSMELESHKQFYNLEEEIKRSKLERNYCQNKLYSINLSTELVLETIKRMIHLY